ncbi:hypothetical protein [Brevibacillus nitrificans]|uniref:hypothetical protein n=1 Tax=Brevibacillus nitrificans TaxID=651560 RepID=UPI00285DDCD8|nr:hypothetical protein [Brevibacillus nitrificans]MDR7319700.1 hypothetical protein [Brevibacillus nitrificans]
MERQKNDDTKTKLGDTYHYFIVLEHCLNLKDNEVIYVEKYGDIAVLSDTNPINLETKRHEGEHLLSDRHIDFWKTLKNWIDNYKNMRLFKKLILFTTSVLPDNSSFDDWNISSAVEKLAILKKIGSEIKDREKGFRGLFDEIFSVDEGIILEILEKVELQLGATDITEIKEKIIKHPIFKVVRKKDHISFIHELMGYILTKPVSYPHVWEITCEKFDSYIVEIRDRYSGHTRPLSEPPGLTTAEVDKTSFYGRKFVAEIKKIKYESVIDSAITHYWKAQQILYYNSNNNPIFLVDFNEYQGELNESLNYLKENKKDICDMSDNKDVVQKSKSLYNDAMLLPPNDFGTVSPIRHSFQRGIIHKIVDERDFKWNLHE